MLKYIGFFTIVFANTLNLTHWFKTFWFSEFCFYIRCGNYILSVGFILILQIPLPHRPDHKQALDQCGLRQCYCPLHCGNRQRNVPQ